jgi:hypothetical protein
LRWALRAHSNNAAGAPVDSGDVKKHRNDVFRLLQLLAADAAIDLPETIADDMLAVLAAVTADDTFKPADIKLRISREEAMARLSSAYRL